jgi:RNA polymerase sigma factor (sigma-70 family)
MVTVNPPRPGGIFVSRLDYRFKEISVDPAFLDSRFHAPATGENEEEEKLGEGREAFIRARMREVRKAMDENLTPRQKECLELYYLRGLSQETIAGILRIHQTTVSQHIDYALKKLRKVFRE